MEMSQARVIIANATRRRELVKSLLGSLGVLGVLAADSVLPERLVEMRNALLLLVVFIVICLFAQIIPSAQTQSPTPKQTVYLLKPSHIFDGETAQLHDGWSVLVRGEKIERAGPASEIKAP